MEPAWLVWARELQAIAQTGLTFTTGTYDRERYTAIRSLAARMMVTHSDANFVRVEGLSVEFGRQVSAPCVLEHTRDLVREDACHR